MILRGFLLLFFLAGSLFVQAQSYTITKSVNIFGVKTRGTDDEELAYW
jgi:hypothetical protein